MHRGWGSGIWEFKASLVYMVRVRPGRGYKEKEKIEKERMEWREGGRREKWRGGGRKEEGRKEGNETVMSEPIKHKI